MKFRKTFGIIGMIIMVSMVASLMSFGISAEEHKIGDVINHTLYTDIETYIDGHQIRSYNVDGNMAIVAEDLRAYGFWVLWYPEERELHIERPVKDGKVQYPYSYPEYSKDPLSEPIGMPADDILYTDIVTKVAGHVVNGYNINGETVIIFKELTAFGSVIYDNNTRTSSFRTDDKTVKLLNSEKENVDQNFLTRFKFSETVADDIINITLTVTDDMNIGTDTVFEGRDFAPVSENEYVYLSLSDDLLRIITYPALRPEPSEVQDVITETVLKLLAMRDIPNITESSDISADENLMGEIHKMLKISYNGEDVSGYMYMTGGNGHRDYVFKFYEKMSFGIGDIIEIQFEK